MQAINCFSLFSKNIPIEDHNSHCHYHQLVLVVLGSYHLVLLLVLVHLLEVLEQQQLVLEVLLLLHQMVLLDILDLMGHQDKNFHFYHQKVCFHLLLLHLQQHFHLLQQYREQLIIKKIHVIKLSVKSFFSLTCCISSFKFSKSFQVSEVINLINDT